MLKGIFKYSDKFASKWLILAIDLLIVGISFLLATIARFNFDLAYVDAGLFKFHLSLVVGLHFIAFLIFRTFSGIIRHTSMEDAVLLYRATFVSSLILLCLSNFDLGKFSVFVSIPNSIILINFFIVLVTLVFSRILVKHIYINIINTYKIEQSVLIYGAGHLGIITKNTLLKDKTLNYKILGFVDDNINKIGKSIEGIKVYSRIDAQRRFIENEAIVNKNFEVIFAIQDITSAKRSEIVDALLDNDISIKSIPPIKQWINGELRTNQIKQIKIEDLLEREPIQLNNRLVSSFVKEKVIFITGAAGSIGSELVRQVIVFEPKKLVLIDQAESALYELETDLLRLGVSGNNNLEFEVRNVCNRAQIKELFTEYKPQVIFHAAAYKHVPMMERNPFKAVEVNSMGTKVLADLASEHKTERFVLISTDKAVNPTNVMGASKRMAEMYVQSLNTQHHNSTRFITTRFGNVLGSNGSVIPLFKKQIQNGGPITVTHPEIIRYFMTIPEACQLVLEAGTMGKGGEIYVFEMGEAVKILDLAKRMIKLSGFEPNVNMDIAFTGLRPGEKLYEELIATAENSMATHHPKILVAKVRPVHYDELNEEFMQLKKGINDMSSKEIVIKLKELIPEFISKNSIYENLDKKIHEV